MAHFNETRAESRVMRPVIIALLALVMGASLSFLATWGIPNAYADTLATGSVVATQATSSKYKIIKVTSKMQRAYKRAVKACMDYKNKPNPIVVDMSDLKLTSKQAIQVGEMLHGNGELFFINTYNDSAYGKRQFVLPCYYSDEQIARMQKELDSVTSKALKRIGPKMNAATKVHMLHDFLIDHINYTVAQKDAYTGLVKKQGDCFSYALSMDYLLRKAGFATDMAFNESLDHAWNLVKIGKYWFHVDPTFDASLSYQQVSYSEFMNWTNEKCHIYLLQSDKSMARKYVDPFTGIELDSHAGWTTHHRCLSDANFKSDIRGKDGTFSEQCNEYKKIVKSFKVGGIKYAAITGNLVKVSAVTGSKQKKAKTITIPATVTYKKTKYYVTGIQSKAFKGTKAKILKIASTKLSADSVKNSLKGSKVATVKLKDKAVKKKSAYKKYFSKANCGKKVNVRD